MAGKLFVREWRKHRELTLEQLAERIGTSKGHLSDIENGRRPYNQAFLEAAAEALRSTPADLLRRGPEDPQGIETTGLDPKQVDLLKGMADDMRRRAG